VRRVLGRSLGFVLRVPFLFVPVIGRVAVLGYLAAVAIAGIENAVVVGGLSALSAALYSIGMPRDSVINYETAVKADNFLVMANGTGEEIGRAKSILVTAIPIRVDVHSVGKAAEPTDNLAHAHGSVG
jgi:hypothetical protein